MLYLKIP